MVRNSLKGIVAGLIACGMLATPSITWAQNCDRAQARGVVYDDYGRATQARPVRYETARPAARRSAVRYGEREPERTKTKSALMIAGSAAAGAGVGGALKGTKGALIGAAIGGGSASIYEAAKRR